MKRKIGYTTGVFDLFHIGHLNILKNAKAKCEILIVGVTTDELVEKIKGKKPIIPFEERIEIVKSIKYVDKVTSQSKIDELEDYRQFQFDIIFKGSDWRNTPKWNTLEKEFSKLGVVTEFLPYTITTSSTKIRNILESTNT